VFPNAGMRLRNTGMEKEQKVRHKIKILKKSSKRYFSKLDSCYILIKSIKFFIVGILNAFKIGFEKITSVIINSRHFLEKFAKHHTLIILFTKNLREVCSYFA
jgi:hypothetical protein